MQTEHVEHVGMRTILRSKTDFGKHAISQLGLDDLVNVELHPDVAREMYRLIQDLAIDLMQEVRRKAEEGS